MSIQKFIIVVLLLVVNTIPAFSSNILFLEGGIPVVEAKQLVDDGMRLGNAAFLRKAWGYYENSILIDGNSRNASLELGKIYFYLSLLGDSTQNDFEKAKEYADREVKLNPNSADAHRALGLILAGRGAVLDGLSELTLAANLNPGNEYLIGDLAMIHLAAHQPKKAIALLEGKSLKNGWSYIVLSMAWSQQNKKGKALLNLLKAKKKGYSGYWLNEMMVELSKSTNLPIE